MRSTEPAEASVFNAFAGHAPHVAEAPAAMFC
jgi:hypothetical protein